MGCLRLQLIIGHGLAALSIVLGAPVRAQTSALLSNSELPFHQPSLPVLRASPKKVFAHYFTQFPLSIDNLDPTRDYYSLQYLTPEGENGKHRLAGGYLRDRPLPQLPRRESNWQALNYQAEVRRASAIGLDGFSGDILSFEGEHWERVQQLLDAAQSVDPGFKILLMPDMEAAFQAHPEKLAEAIHELAAHPSVCRWPDGRLVVAPFNAQRQTAAWWKNWLEKLKEQGVDIAFLPLFQGWRTYAKDFAPISAGFSDWGWRTPKAQASWRDVPQQAHQFVPVWMAPVSPQDFRPYAFKFWEAGNSENFRVMWENAIAGGDVWVQLITWNDYSEHTEIAPSTGIQSAFYDLSAYYISQFKTGRPPVLRRDALYYFYRKHSTTASPAKQTQQFAPVASDRDPPRDEIELLALLTSPGRLEIEIGGQTKSLEAPGGLTSFCVPLNEGRPIFRLRRSGQPVITVTGAFQISNTIDYQDLLYHAGSSSPTNSITELPATSR